MFRSVSLRKKSSERGGTLVVRVVSADLNPSDGRKCVLFFGNGAALVQTTGRG
jgi:hypothetical protein